MIDRTCDTCGKVFQLPCHLKRHKQRKTPCDPIVVPSDGTTSCRYCGRSFASEISMYRHVRKSCKIANSAEGMEKLMDHTLARQHAAKIDQLQTQAAAHSAQMAVLTAMMKQMMAGAVGPAGAAPTNQIAANTVGQLNTGPVVNNTVNIHPWSSEEKLVIPTSMLRAAFTENPRLVEYCRMSDEEKTDPETAVPYVLEALVDLTRRAHADPAARNVYLNPKRADQVMVFDEESWKVVALVDAIRGIFDSVAGNISRIVRMSQELPIGIQGSACYVPMMYEDEPDTYVVGAKKTLAAHLSNTAPTLK